MADEKVTREQDLSEKLADMPAVSAAPGKKTVETPAATASQSASATSVVPSEQPAAPTAQPAAPAAAPAAQLATPAAQSTAQPADVVVITGMSGAGRTEAMHTFEDLGYYVIDNLPPSLILSLTNIVGINSGVGRHLAIVCDLRTQGLFDELLDSLEDLTAHDISYKILFLDATDEVLRRRYSSVRRSHPIAQEGETNADAIRRERKLLSDVRNHADEIIDTSRLKPLQLRRKIQALFSELTDQQMLDVHVFSFGFKYGMPQEADLMIDVRFLPNPFYDPEMRNLTGLDEKVSSFVLERPETKSFLTAWYSLLDAVMPGYVAEGKSQLSIAVGCTGGQHRSVTLANETASYLGAQGYQVQVAHRDISRAERR